MNIGDLTMSIDQNLTIYMKRIMNALITVGKAEFSLVEPNGTLIIEAGMVLQDNEIVYAYFSDDSKVLALDAMYEAVNRRLMQHRFDSLNTESNLAS